MLTFSEEEILFQYKEQSHLASELTLGNHSNARIYYKVLNFLSYTVKRIKTALLFSQK